ncbi:MAG: CPBP family intramembrane metalloprotease [Chloroflexi bacterium]|nr:CPBP family intramembrane metalloprotease [Chloroflexota bacterium]
METHATKPASINFWMKIPLTVRAILVGLTVSTLGVLSWSIIATFVPLPWALILELGLLWVYWQYFSGRWWPNRTQAVREANFRRVKLPAKAWAPASLAALLIVIIEQSGLAVTFRLMEFPAERFASAYSFLENIPLWAAWLVVIMISIVAGICEEIGFRGYMQVPLEKRYGPAVAISIVSVVFVLVHLHQAWAAPILAHIFFMSVLFGAIAHYSGSLIPGIAAHIIMDIFNFSFWWTKIGWQFNQETIFNTGLDFHFIAWVSIFVASIAFFVFTIANLKSLKLGK